MEIEYIFTLQDEIDNWVIFNDWSSSQSWFKWILKGLTILCIFWGIYLIFKGITGTDISSNTNLNPFLTSPLFMIFAGIMSIIMGGIFSKISDAKFLLKLGYDKEIEKKWQKKSRQEEARKIIINSEELTFTTEFTEQSWTWKAFKTYFEGKQGFLIWFYSSDTPYYVPKKVFQYLDERENFKKILLQHNKA